MQGNYLTHGVQEPIHQILRNKDSLFQILVAASRVYDKLRFDKLSKLYMCFSKRMEIHTPNPASSDLVSIQDPIIGKLEQNSLDLKYTLSIFNENIYTNLEDFKGRIRISPQNYESHLVIEKI